MVKRNLVNLGHARGEKHLRLMEKIQKDGLCPFCRENLEKYHAEPIIEETSFWVVTKNSNPYKGSRIHLLLIFKIFHAKDISEIPGMAMEDLQKIVRKYSEQFNLKGATLLIRFGDHDYTGGSVEHLHVHLVSGGKRTKESKSIKTKIGYEI